MDRLFRFDGVSWPVPGGVSPGVGSVILNETPFSGFSLLSSDGVAGFESDVSSDVSIGGNGSLVSSVAAVTLCPLLAGVAESTGGRSVFRAAGDSCFGEAIDGAGDPVPRQEDMASVYIVACSALQNR